VAGFALAKHPARLDQLDVALLAQPLQLALVELLEQEQRAQLVDVAVHLSHVLRRSH